MAAASSSSSAAAAAAVVNGAVALPSPASASSSTPARRGHHHPGAGSSSSSAKPRRATSTYSVEEFQDLLSADESLIDLKRVREAASYGVPQPLRTEVWKLLLGVAKPDKSEELSTSRALSEAFSNATSANEKKSQKALIDKSVLNYARSLIKSCHRHLEFFQRADSRLRFEQLLTLFLSNHSNYAVTSRELQVVPAAAAAAAASNGGTTQLAVHDIGSLVWLLAPFLYTMEEEVDAYFSFSHMLSLIESSWLVRHLDKALSTFLMLFRTFQEELCTYFEDEDLSPNEWAISWIKELLARSLPLPCLLRLWDTYLASDEGFDLHLYVCLAILMVHTEELLELEYSELRTFLQHLPPMDMDQIIMHAHNLKAEAIALKLL